jgi:excisionase family DNA binding protein
MDARGQVTSVPDPKNVQDHAAPKPVRSDALTCTVAEAQRITGLSRSKIYEAIAAKKLKSTKVDRRRLIHMQSLRHLVGC